MTTRSTAAFLSDKVIASALVALGLAAAGLAVRSGIIRFKTFERSVEVRGLAEQIVESNEASWKVDFSVSSNEMGDLNVRMAQANDAILTYLKAEGFFENEIEKSPVNLSDRLSQDYGTGKGLRYTARGGFLVSSTRVAELAAASRGTDELLKKGVIVSGTQLTYYYTALNSIKPAMLEDATRNAREAALSFAKTAGARLGEIKSASQGMFSIGSPTSEYDPGTSLKKKIRVVTRVEFFLN